MLAANGAQRSIIRVLTRLLLFGGVSLAAFADGTVYSTLPAQLPVDFSQSWGFDAGQTLEWGGVVQPDYTNGAYLTSATVGLSNWAYEAKYLDYVGQPGIDSTGYDVTLGLNLYTINPADNSPVPYYSTTTTAHIPWRTAPDTPTGCQTSDGLDGYTVGENCYGGSAQTVTFSLPNLAMPSQFIYGFSFPTTSTGGSSGPWDSLNLALSLDHPTVGVNPALDTTTLPFGDTIYINTNNADNLTTGTVNVFSQDSGWISAGYGSGVIQFDAVTTAVPEPGTSAMIGFGLLGVSLLVRRRKS